MEQGLADATEAIGRITCVLTDSLNDNGVSATAALKEIAMQLVTMNAVLARIASVLEDATFEDRDDAR